MKKLALLALVVLFTMLLSACGGSVKEAVIGFSSAAGVCGVVGGVLLIFMVAR